MNISKAQCGSCGNDRITYNDGDGTHLVLTFAIPVDAPLDDRDIKRYGTQFAVQVANALLRERERRGFRVPTIIRA